MTPWIEQPGNRAAFMDAVRKIGTINGACKSLGVSDSSWRIWRKRDPTLEVDMRQALRDYLERGLGEVQVGLGAAAPVEDGPDRDSRQLLANKYGGGVNLTPTHSSHGEPFIPVGKANNLSAEEFKDAVAKREAMGVVLKRQASRSCVTPKLLARYLCNLSECGILGMAAFSVNLSPQTIYKIRREDPEFDQLVKDALEFYGQKVMVVFQDVALNGTLKAIKGRTGANGEEEIIGYDQVIYDRLLLKLAQKFDPELREKQEIEHKGSGGVLVVVAPPKSEDEFEKMFGDAANKKPEVVADSPPGSLPAPTP